MKIDGLPVLDSDEPIDVTITARDIKRGDTKDPGGCAAALACMRQFHATAARVHVGRTYIKLGKKWLRFRTSEALRTEIVAYDRGGAFMPGDYRLEPMPKSLRLGERRNPGPKKTKGKPRKTWHMVSGVRQHGAAR